MLIGFELPNHPNPAADTWAQVDALRSTVVKVRPYHLTPPTLDEIRKRGLTVILRNNADEGIHFSAGARYDELDRALETLAPVTPSIYCILDNEPNHHNNNEPATPAYWDKCLQVMEWLAQLHPDVKYVTPPLAVAQDEAAWYAAGLHVIPRFDRVGVHLYGTTDNSLVTYALDLACVFGIPLVADELGNTDHHLSPDNKAFAVASYTRQAAERGVEAMTIFIAKHPTPEWNYCTLPTEKLGMIADAAGSDPSPGQPKPEPAAPTLADRVLAQYPGPQRTPSKPLVWDQWPRVVRETATLRPHLSVDEVVRVALGPLATMAQESGGKVDADGDLRSNGYYCSRGLYQLNTCGGAGSTLMKLHGITNPDLLYDLAYQYEHAQRLILATETELYWSRVQNRAFRPGPALQGVQNSSSDPTGAGYDAAYRQLQREMTPVEDDMPTVPIGNFDIPDLRGRYPSTYIRRPLADITNISIHHSVTETLPATASEADELAALDAIHAYHRTQFRGISYHMVVCPSGNCYLTGEWGTVRYLVGGDGNLTTLGILLHGDFSNEPPGDAQLDAARWLIANVRYQLGNGALPVLGHRDLSSTQCPGNTWETWKHRLTDDEPPVDTRTPLHIQLDSLNGYISQLGDHPLAVPMRAALLAAKDAANIE